MSGTPRQPGFLVAACAAAVLGLGGPFAAISWRASLGPLDLEPTRAVSTMVLDRDGRLLRAFTTSDGRWRLPASIEDVDPRYLALLQAYEDRRFAQHRGIDFRALARAAAQAMRHGRVVSGASTLTMQVARLLRRQEVRRAHDRVWFGGSGAAPIVVGLT